MKNSMENGKTVVEFIFIYYAFCGFVQLVTNTIAIVRHRYYIRKALKRIKAFKNLELSDKLRMLEKFREA
jgi:hypothetical protein